MTTPAPRVLYSHPKLHARLVRHDLRAAKEVVDAARRSARPRLVERPPLAPMYGKPCRMRRNVGFFADPNDTYGYFFSGQLMETQPLTEELKALLEYVNKHFGSDFNGILVNEYVDGQDYISRHRDDETALDKNTLDTVGVVSISTGQRRTLRIREYAGPGKTGPIVCDAPTEPYHALCMVGKDFQTALTHEVPKEARAGSEPRLSFTFRRHCKALEETQWAEWSRRQEAKRAHAEQEDAPAPKRTKAQ